MQGSVKSRNSSAIRQCFKQFYAQCLDVDSWSLQVSQGTDESMEAGHLHIDFAKVFA